LEIRNWRINFTISELREFNAKLQSHLPFLFHVKVRAAIHANGHFPRGGSTKNGFYDYAFYNSRKCWGTIKMLWFLLNLFIYLFLPSVEEFPFYDCAFARQIHYVNRLTYFWLLPGLFPWSSNAAFRWITPDIVDLYSSGIWTKEKSEERNQWGFGPGSVFYHLGKNSDSGLPSRLSNFAFEFGNVVEETVCISAGELTFHF
jgi:hypothetical protein